MQLTFISIKTPEKLTTIVKTQINVLQITIKLIHILKDMCLNFIKYDIFNKKQIFDLNVCTWIFTYMQKIIALIY